MGRENQLISVARLSRETSGESADILGFSALVAGMFVKAGLEQFRRIKRSGAGQQFIKQDPKAVNITPRVHLHTRQYGLFGTHVSGCAYQHFKRGEQGLVRQSQPGGCLGNASKRGSAIFKFFWGEI